jgi:FtsP/CotA-like multicopper oxidase with cupredoxin domain
MMMEVIEGHSIMCMSLRNFYGFFSIPCFSPNHQLLLVHLPFTCSSSAWSNGAVELTSRTYREPRTPSLFTALTMGNDSFNPAVYGHQTNAIPYPHGANIQLTVYNWDDGFHPFHFHG